MLKEGDNNGLDLLLRELQMIAFKFHKLHLASLIESLETNVVILV